MVSGTIIALVPIAVPISILVNGNKNTTKRIKGMDLPISTIRLRMKLMILFGNNPPGRVSETTDPKGIAITQLMSKDINDM
jgi:hypothetical protein